MKTACSPTIKPNFFAADMFFLALFHAKGHDTERLERRGDAGTAGMALSMPM
ncbi:MAG: hypothetical protein R3E79_18215 [Caldilineaceae bacterium]